jgi:hypothetical protein
MEQIVAEENMENPSNQMMTEQSSRPRKGGFRTMPFIIGNDISHTPHTQTKLAMHT